MGCPEVGSPELDPDDQPTSALPHSPRRDSTQVLGLPNQSKMELVKVTFKDKYVADDIHRRPSEDGRFLLNLCAVGQPRKNGLGFIRPDRKPPDLINLTAVQPSVIIIAIILIVSTTRNMIFSYGNQLANMFYEYMTDSKGFGDEDTVFGILGCVHSHIYSMQQWCNNESPREY